MRRIPIGILAERSGLAVSALRFYDQLGLLGDVTRDAAGRRLFPLEAQRRLALIRAAQYAGFTLADIKLIFDDSASDSIRQRWARLVTKRLPEVEATIKQLQQLHDALTACLDCGCLSLTNCSILGASTKNAATDQATIGAS